MDSQTTAAESDLSAQVDSLEAAFRRVSHLVKRTVVTLATAVHPELRQAGWIVFSLVHRGAASGEPITVAEIIAETGMDKSVVSRQLRALAEWGLVETRRSAADARVIVVTPTELARKRFAEVRARQREIYQGLLAQWPEGDLRTLEELLNRLADVIGDVG